MATANVADKPLGGRIEPPDDSRCVEDIARDADVLQSLLDVTADLQASGHHGSVADSGRRWTKACELHTRASCSCALEGEW